MDFDIQSVKKFNHSLTPCIEKISKGWYGRKCQEGKTQRMHSLQKVVVKEAKISKMELRNSNTFKIKTSLSFQGKHDQKYYLMLR